MDEHNPEVRQWIHRLVDEYFDKGCGIRVAQDKKFHREDAEGEAVFKFEERTLTIVLTTGVE